MVRLIVLKLKEVLINNDTPTMCIIHKGFKGFRALSPVSILGGKLIDKKPAIPYEIIH